MLANYLIRTMAASCARFAYLLKRLHVEKERRVEDAILAVMWMVIEVNTAIFGKCRPTMCHQLATVTIEVLI